MIAFDSLLDTRSNRQVREIWDWLEIHCGLAGIRTTPLPHFSWQSAENYDLSLIRPALEKLAGELTPFGVKTAGLGIFTGKEPVLYISLVKTGKLLEVHQRIWETMTPFAQEVNPLYAPGQWIPHVTLAYQDISPEKLSCAIKDLAFLPIEMEMVIDHLAILFQSEGKDGVLAQYALSPMENGR